ncbi:MAG: hypothetical protein DRJ56_08670, partial [Thermoprotei archaeon]
LTLRAARDRKTTLLGLGFLGIGVGDGAHGLGHVLADLYGGLPGQPTWADAFEAAATAVSVSLATFFFLTIRLYASLAKRGEFGLADRALGGLTLLTSALAFSSWAYLQAWRGFYMKLPGPWRPTVLALSVSAVLGMVAMGYAACFSFLSLAREKKRSADPVVAERYRYAFWAMLVMVAAVTLVLAHPFLVAKPVLLSVATALKTLFLVSSAFLLYTAVTGPEWFVRRLAA